ncbi:MAG TPA: hypothetical protein VL549_08140, partial [Gemmatimonadales bacterium]|nr:hypothetical protein [Gemmatimonadales bacterium]
WTSGRILAESLLTASGPIKDEACRTKTRKAEMAEQSGSQSSTMARTRIAALSARAHHFQEGNDLA